MYVINNNGRYGITEPKHGDIASDYYKLQE